MVAQEEQMYMYIYTAQHKSNDDRVLEQKMVVQNTIANIILMQSPTMSKQTTAHNKLWQLRLCVSLIIR